MTAQHDVQHDVMCAIVRLSASACATWAVYGDNSEFGIVMNRLTNAIFVHNQGLASPEDVIDYCDQYVQAHERRIDIHALKGNHDAAQVCNYYEDIG